MSEYMHVHFLHITDRRVRVLFFLALCSSMALIPGVYFFHWNCNCETHEAHLTEVDLEFGKYTKEQLELFHNFVPKPGLGTKTPPIEADGIHQSDILTIVIDFKDSTQPVLKREEGYPQQNFGRSRSPAGR